MTGQGKGSESVIRGSAAVFLAIIVSAASVAQEAAAPLAQADESYSQERRRLIENSLQLTPAEAERFWPVYAQFEKDLFEVTERRRAMIAKFGENYDGMTDDIARQLIADRLQLEEARARLRKKYLPRFEKVLPVKKLARYYQIESKINASVDAGIAEELPLIN